MKTQHVHIKFKIGDVIIRPVGFLSPDDNRVMKKTAIKSPRCILGRHRTNDIIVNAPTISKHHAVIYSKANKFFIADCHSSNGTFLNNVIVSTYETIIDGEDVHAMPDPKLLTPICDGDHIVLGSVDILFYFKMQLSKQQNRLVYKKRLDFFQPSFVNSHAVIDSTFNFAFGEKGLIGMGRDVILQLIKLIRDGRKIREIIGICSEGYFWKSHSFFLVIRRESRQFSTVLPLPVKLIVFEKIKAEIESKAKQEEQEEGKKNIDEGEFTVLAGLLPSKRLSAKKNTQEHQLMHSVLDLFIDVIYKGKNRFLWNEALFDDSADGSRDSIGCEPLYWLFVLFTSMIATTTTTTAATATTTTATEADSSAALKAALVLSRFRRHLSSMRMETVLRTLVSSNSSSPPSPSASGTVGHDKSSHSRSPVRKSSGTHGASHSRSPRSSRKQ